MEAEGRKYVQYYARRNINRVFKDGGRSQLLYASYVDSEISGFPRVMHSHNNSAELVLICRGNAEFMIGCRTYPVRAGNLVVYNAGVVHDELTSIQNPVSLWCVGVGGLELPGLPPECLVGQDAGVVFDVEGDYGNLHFLFEMIFNGLQTGEEENEEAARYLTSTLLLRVRTLLRSAPVVEALQEKDGKREKSNAGILGMRVKNYLDEHYWENVSLTSLSEAMNCSKYYLSHVFKDLCGYSPMNYLIRRRIGEAQNLLIGTDLPIAEITWQLGYDTQSYFTSQFMKVVGMSPNVYRKKYAHRPQEKGKRK